MLWVRNVEYYLHLSYCIFTTALYILIENYYSSCKKNFSHIKLLFLWIFSLPQLARATKTAMRDPLDWIGGSRRLGIIFAKESNVFFLMNGLPSSGLKVLWISVLFPVSWIPVLRFSWVRAHLPKLFTILGKNWSFLPYLEYSFGKFSNFDLHNHKLPFYWRPIIIHMLETHDSHFSLANTAQITTC